MQGTDQRPGRRHGTPCGRLAPGPRGQPDSIGPLAQDRVGAVDGRCLIIACPCVEQSDHRTKCQGTWLAPIEFCEFSPLLMIDGHDSRDPCVVTKVRCSNEATPGASSLIA